VPNRTSAADTRNVATSISSAQAGRAGDDDPAEREPADLRHLVGDLAQDQLCS
jgi:hypothetical protein